MHGILGSSRFWGEMDQATKLSRAYRVQITVSSPEGVDEAASPAPARNMIKGVWIPGTTDIPNKETFTIDFF